MNQRAIVIFAITLIAAFSSHAWGGDKYYKLGKASIEYRQVTVAQDKGDTLVLSDLAGNSVRLSEGKVITTEDIEGIQVIRRKDASDKIIEVSLTVQFKPSSYKKVQEITTSWKGSKVAIIKDNTVFLTPTLIQPLKERAGFAVSPEIANQFLNGMEAVKQ